MEADVESLLIAGRLRMELLRDSLQRTGGISSHDIAWGQAFKMFETSAKQIHADPHGEADIETLRTQHHGQISFRATVTLRIC